MLLSEWKKTAPNREAMSNKVLAVLKPVLADLGADGDPACWVLWGEDPEFRYSVMAPTQAGLVTVTVRLNSGSGDGPRATGKLIRWGKLQVSDLGVESADGHRLGLVAGVDGRAYRVAAPVVVQAVPPDVTIPKPAVDKPEAPKAGAKSGLKAVPAPLAASGAAKGPAKEVAEGAPVAGDQPPARKPAKTPGGKTRAAWVAPHPIGLPAPQTPTPAVAPLRLKPPAAKPEAAKPPASPAAHPAAAARSAEPAEGGPVWEVPEPSDREVKRPRTWTP